MATAVGQLLVQAGFIDNKQLQQVLETHKKEGGVFESHLISDGIVTPDQLLPVLSKYYNVPIVDLSAVDIDPPATKVIPLEIIQKHKLIPFARKGATLRVAMTDPSNISAIDDIKFMTGYDIEPYVTTEQDINDAINKYYDSEQSLQTVLQSIEDEDELDLRQDATLDAGDAEDVNAAEEAPVVKLVNLILSEAIKTGVSDIHIEPYEKKLRVRYRMDGALTEVMTPPLRLKNALTSRLKIMANLDISEKRLPQDGRIKLKLKRKEVDIRVSILPCLFGEKVVMRILDQDNLMLDLGKLGFSPKAHEDFLGAVRSPWGMVLVTGPTGSGKTTTLYSAMSSINTIDVNIMTAEDPVEYNLMGVNQCQTNSNIGLTFAAALKSFLRQDPDIVMVGEIRDLETAEISVKAALTGHLVLSTLHTNDAPSTINRMLNMGVEPFNVASSVIVILAQRLIRRLCVKCKRPAEPPIEALMRVGFKKEDLPGIAFHEKVGCATCCTTGYKGRVGLYEVMLMTDSLRDLIVKNSPTSALKQQAIKDGMTTLRASGLEKIKAGVTTIDEVTSATMAD